MRELVYLSDAKLGQFLPDANRFPWTASSVSVSTPFGGVGVAPETSHTGARLRHLRRVVREVAASARSATDVGLLPGQWVQFESLLNYVVLAEPHDHVLLFADPLDPAAGAGQGRLLMHGTAGHLLAERPPQEYPSPDAEQRRWGSGREAFRTLATATADDASEAEWTLGFVRNHLPAAPDPHPGLRARVEARAGWLAAGADSLLRLLDQQLSADTAVLLRGYARVTFVVRERGEQRVLVASPLYAEYVRG
ncbi:SAVMC3_10250 family protein [Streptomyces sp. NPDC026672]|uniref:SAVMC3_10250 family protein n=1 Tax=unclassified Streptomyces TaxID=2593676 RepID=UPI0033DAC435